MVVADFGVGTGHWSMAMAKYIGDDGKIYSIDIQKDILARLKTHAEEEGIENLETVWGDVDEEQGTGLADGIIDFVLMSNILFQSEKKDGVAREAFRVLKKGGKAAVIDWTDKVDKQTAKKIFLEQGLIVLEEFEAGEQHYGLLFKKP